MRFCPAPSGDRGAIYTAEGGLSQEGIRRIENALRGYALAGTGAGAGAPSA